MADVKKQPFSPCLASGLFSYVRSSCTARKIDNSILKFREKEQILLDPSLLCHASWYLEGFELENSFLRVVIHEADLLTVQCYGKMVNFPRDSCSDGQSKGADIIMYQQKLTHICREIFLTVNSLIQKAFPVTNGDILQNNNNRGKNSATSSLNEGSPSSEFYLNYLFFEQKKSLFRVLSQPPLL